MDVIKKFLKWIEEAPVSQRAAAATALARAFIQRDLSLDQRVAVEAALTLLVDDVSAKVRLALSETLSLSRRAPPQVVAALAADQVEVATPVLLRSPLLTEGDLVDRVAVGREAVQVLVASRPQVSLRVSAAIAEVGSAAACLALLANDGAEIASVSLRRMIERHGDDAGLRGRLAAEPRLPADCRHLLVARVGEALAAAPLVQGLMGSTGARRLTREACTQAAVTLIDSVDSRAHGALVEQLRLSGDLTSAFLVRAVAYGKVDFFGAALVALTGQREERVRVLLSAARCSALSALLARAGLNPAAHRPILAGLAIWRAVAGGDRVAGVQEVSWHMLQALEAGQGGEESERAALAGLLRRIHLETLRENARLQALALAA